jgi:hypothetical protein
MVLTLMKNNSKASYICKEVFSFDNITRFILILLCNIGMTWALSISVEQKSDFDNFLKCLGISFVSVGWVIVIVFIIKSIWEGIIYFNIDTETKNNKKQDTLLYDPVKDKIIKSNEDMTLQEALNFLKTSKLYSFINESLNIYYIGVTYDFSENEKLAIKVVAENGYFVIF